MRRSIALASLFVILTVAANAQTRVGTAAGACGRECLRGFVTQYLDAMVSHNPKAIPTVPTARFTEDTKTLPLGEGLWKGASKIRSYRQDFLDVREGEAASFVIVEESGTPVMLALRLKIENKKIIEIETMVTRSKAEGALFDIENLTTPHAAMNVVPDASQRMSRAELIRIAEIYPVGLKVGGNFDAVEAIIDFDKAIRDPEHPTKVRQEYDSGDHVHPSAAGYKAMADLIPLRLLGGKQKPK